MDRLGWKVVEFAAALGVSRSKGYEIVAAYPELAIRIGSSLRVIPERAHAWIERLHEEQTAGRNGSTR